MEYSIPISFIATLAIFSDVNEALFIYAGIYSILHASVNKNEAFTLSNGTRHLGHGSHGSHMFHYSGVICNHYIKTKSSSILNLGEQQNTLIKQVILKENGINKRRCSISDIERCKLLEIDGVNVNKWCYKINYIVEFGSYDTVNTHQYFVYYIQTDGKYYYLYRVESPNATKPNLICNDSLLNNIYKILNEK